MRPTATGTLAMPPVMFSIALAVDYSSLSLQYREAQGQADLAAIVAASDPANARRILVDHFARNGLDQSERVLAIGTTGAENFDVFHR